MQKICVSQGVSTVKSYASDLDSVITSSDYSKFISYLRSLLTDEIVFEGIYKEDELIEE